MPQYSQLSQNKRRVKYANACLKAKEIFTEAKLIEIYNDYHKDDGQDNVMIESFRSKAKYKFIFGAKNNGKSLTYCVIETIYKLLWHPNSNSAYCRNIYKHIKNTLQPTFEKALGILKKRWNIDLIDNYEINTESAKFYNGQKLDPQVVYFENFEKIQAFQGFSTKDPDFYFIELVLDEVIEDPENKTFKNPEQEQEFYDLQWRSMPMLEQATIYRDLHPADVRVEVKVTFNPFTTKHWAFQKYINAIIEQSEENKTLLEQNHYLQAKTPENASVSVIATCLSVLYKNDIYISEEQRQYYAQLKNDNLRKWTITVLGWYFEAEENNEGYWLRQYMRNEKDEVIDYTYSGNVQEDINAGLVEFISDGVDVGNKDATAWVRVALYRNGNMVVLDGRKEILTKEAKKDKKNFSRNVAEVIVELMKESDIELKIYHDPIMERLNSTFHDTYNPIVALDNYVMIDWLNNMDLKRPPYFYDLTAVQGIRKDSTKSSISGQSEFFGIENRQKFLEKAYMQKKIWFANGTEWLHEDFMNQFKQPNEEQRDETVNREIYDRINAFELAVSLWYKDQIINAESLE